MINYHIRNEYTIICDDILLDKYDVLNILHYIWYIQYDKWYVIYLIDDIMWYDVIWCDMMWNNLIWCDMMWYNVIWYDMIRCCVGLCYIILSHVISYLPNYIIFVLQLSNYIMIPQDDDDEFMINMKNMMSMSRNQIQPYTDSLSHDCYTYIFLGS